MVLRSPVTSTLIPCTILSVVYRVDQSVGGDGYRGRPWQVVWLDFSDIKELNAGHVGRVPLMSSLTTWQRAHV